MRISLLLLVPAGLLLTGCSNWTSRETPVWVWSDMKAQDKFKPQARTGFFADQRASRRPVAGTVAQGLLKENEPYFTGVAQGNYLAQNPEPLSRALLERGRERFNIYCAPCHDQTGSGRGIVPLRTNWMPGNLHDERVVAMVDGELFHVVSHGRRSMPGYKNQIPEADRWAIVAYVRALQRSRRSTTVDVPAELQSKLR
jgi:mono/diheme cytochrome c family protein